MEMLKSLAHNVGLERCRTIACFEDAAGQEDGANRSNNHGTERTRQKALQSSLARRVAHSIEDRCRSWPNTLSTIIAGEMCIFIRKWDASQSAAGG